MTESIYLASVISLSVCVLFGFSNHVQHIALDHMDVRGGTIVNVAVTALLLWLLSPLYLEPASLLTPPVLWFALAGLIVPSLSMTLQTLSVRTIGPGLTAGLASTSPVFAMVIAIAVLGEVVTGRILVGTLIVIAGIGFIALRSRHAGVDWPVWAVAIPLGAALVRGLAHNVIKIGLADLPNPLTASLVAATTSLLVLSIAHTGTRQTLPAWGPGYYWFGLCGVFNGIGLIGLNTALSLGDVVVVSPLVATTPVFTLLVGWLFFRREVIRWPAIAAIAIIFSGCILIITR